MVDLLIAHTGNVPVTRITRKIASSFVLEKVMPLDRTTKTKREHITALSVLFNWLSTTGVLDANPFRGLGKLVEQTKRGTVDKTKRRPWTDKELAKLQKLPEDDAFRGVGLLSLWAGLRTDEAASLKIADVDLKARTVRVTEGKTASAIRIVPLHRAILPAVRKLVKAAETGKRAFLFDLQPSTRDNKRAPSLRAYRRMEELFGEHDNSLVFYGLRHTFITALERAGVDRTLRERISGHAPKDLNSAVYSEGATVEQMRKAVEKVDFKAFRG
jgi:integrase